MSPVLFSISVGSVCGFFNKCKETGPTIYRPYPRRLESQTICRCHYKGRNFLLSYLTLLNPKSDQHQISCNVNALQNRVVIRIKDRITHDKFARYFNKFSPLLLLEMYRGNKWELKFWSQGLKRPWVLVWLGFQPVTCTVVQHSTHWANQRLLYSKYLITCTQRI